MGSACRRRFVFLPHEAAAILPPTGGKVGVFGEFKNGSIRTIERR